MKLKICVTHEWSMKPSEQGSGHKNNKFGIFLLRSILGLGAERLLPLCSLVTPMFNGLSTERPGYHRPERGGFTARMHTISTHW